MARSSAAAALFNRLRSDALGAAGAAASTSDTFGAPDTRFERNGRFDFARIVRLLPSR